MYLFVIGLIIWAIVALVQRKKKKREQARIRAEMARMRAKTKATSARVSAVEKEQEKHAAMLKKHEEEIAKLKFRMAQAESDIEHFTEQLGNLYALLDIEEMARSSAVPGSAEDAKHQRKIITLTNQIHTAETRLEKAKFNKEQAERKIA